MNSGKMLLVSTLIAVLFISAMPSSDSFWTDEAQTYHYAKQTSFRAWHGELLSDKESEALMPLGMFVPWLAAKVMGTTEWRMRAINILWAIAALIPMLVLSRQFSLSWLPLLFAVQPYLWFYTNEARPYTLQMAEGSWLILSLLKYLETEGRGVRWIWCFVVAGVLLCTTSLLGVIPFCAVLAVGLAAHLRLGIRPSRYAWIPIALGIPTLLLLGVYYLWALHGGAESSKVWSVSAGNLAFSIYELLGFAGLGPGRAALRGVARSQVGNVSSNMLPYLPGILALFVMYCVVAVGYYRALRIPQRALYLIVTTAVVVTSALGLAVLAAAAHFPFWGRHLAPVFPAIVIIVAISLSSLSSRQRVSSGVAVILCLTLLVSSLQLRYADRHKKDNYRVAVNHAEEALAAGGRVWWFADVWASRYYGLDVTIKNTSASDMPIRPDGLSGEYQELPPPDLIVLSKPDIYDKTGALREFIRKAGYHQSGQAQAFQFFEK